MIGALARMAPRDFVGCALRHVTLETIAPLRHDPQIGLSALAAR